MDIKIKPYIVSLKPNRDGKYLRVFKVPKSIRTGHMSGYYFMENEKIKSFKIHKYKDYIEDNSKIYNNFIGGNMDIAIYTENKCDVYMFIKIYEDAILSYFDK